MYYSSNRLYIWLFIYIYHKIVTQRLHVGHISSHQVVMEFETSDSIILEGTDSSCLSNKGALITALWEMIMSWWLPPWCMLCHSRRDEDRHLYSNGQRLHELRVWPMCFSNTISCNGKYTLRSSVEIYGLWSHVRHSFCTGAGTLMAYKAHLFSMIMKLKHNQWKESCGAWSLWSTHDVIKWKHSPRYWSFVRGIHRSPALWRFVWYAPE